MKIDYSTWAGIFLALIIPAFIWWVWGAKIAIGFFIATQFVLICSHLGENKK